MLASDHYEDAKKQIQTYKKILTENFFIISDIQRKEYNFEIIIEESKNKIKVQVYFGKKGVKTILQGDVKSSLYNRIREIIFDQQEIALPIDNLEEPELYIGSDESGKGDFFGPLVVAAFFSNRKISDQLKKIGVRDSKELSDQQITFMAKKIKSFTPENFCIVTLNPFEYNEIYPQYGNLNLLLNYLHSKAISVLLDNHKCDTVITDKFSKRDLEITKVSKYSSVRFLQETGAERFTAVAAASILARDQVNFWFDEKYREGLKLQKGSSDIVTQQAKVLIKEVGKAKMNEYSKVHFKTTIKIT